MFTVLITEISWTLKLYGEKNRPQYEKKKSGLLNEESLSRVPYEQVKSIEDYEWKSIGDVEIDAKSEVTTSSFKNMLNRTEKLRSRFGQLEKDLQDIKNGDNPRVDEENAGGYYTYISDISDESGII